jgi:hypothetical protein
MVKTYMAVGHYVHGNYISAREVAKSHSLPINEGILLDDKSKANTLEDLDDRRESIKHTQNLPIFRPNFYSGISKAKEKPSEEFETHDLTMLLCLITVFLCWLGILGIMVAGQ